MSIDWITVVAQLANFLLLIWLLRRFLYRPILDGIDAREAEIARRMAHADEARAAALAAQKRYEEQYRQSVSEQDAMVERALEATHSERAQLMTEARTQLEEEQAEWQKQLERERREFHQRLQQSAAVTLSDLARRALLELADEQLESAIARTLGRQLQPMAHELASAAGRQREAEIITREPLDAATWDALRQELEKMLPEVHCTFRNDPQQAPGVILQVGGARVAWTLDSYMDELERTLTQRHTSTSITPVDEQAS